MEGTPSPRRATRNLTVEPTPSSPAASLHDGLAGRRDSSPALLAGTGREQESWREAGTGAAEKRQLSKLAAVMQRARSSTALLLRRLSSPRGRKWARGRKCCDSCPDLRDDLGTMEEEENVKETAGHRPRPIDNEAETSDVVVEDRPARKERTQTGMMKFRRTLSGVVSSSRQRGASSLHRARDDNVQTGRASESLPPVLLLRSTPSSQRSITCIRAGFLLYLDVRSCAYNGVRSCHGRPRTLLGCRAERSRILQ